MIFKKQFSILTASERTTNDGSESNELTRQ
jgi:hypothetical protein